MRVTLNGVVVDVTAGTTVAALVMNNDAAARRSVTGAPRTPLCGMGTCFECRVRIDGVAHRRGCMVEVREGMIVQCDD